MFKQIRDQFDRRRRFWLGVAQEQGVDIEGSCDEQGLAILATQFSYTDESARKKRVTLRSLPGVER